jgi:hypothetical protein
MMQWGGFAGGFAQGFDNGIRIGKTVNDLRKQQKVDDVRKAAVDEATAARGDSIANLVKDNGITGAPATTTTPAAESGPATAATAEATGQPAVDTPGVTTTMPVVEPAVTATPSSGAPASATPAATNPSATQTPAPTPAQVTPGMPPEAASPVAAPAAAAPAPAAAPAVTPQTALVGQTQPATPAQAAAATGIPAPKRFTVGDQSFDTREQAQAAAAKLAPSQAEFTGKAVAKKLEQHFIETGDIESAEKWSTWAKAKDNERKMETWADAFKAAQTGDYVGSARKLMKLYPDFNDGHTLVSATAVKDASGKEVGFKMTTRDAAGKETTIEHDAQTISRVGLAQMNPQKMFEMDRAEQVAAATARAKAAADKANDERTLRKDLIIEGVKAKNTEARDTRKFEQENKTNATKADQDLEKLTISKQLDQAGVGEKVKAEANTKIDFLKRKGYTDDQITGLVPLILGLGEHKKVTDPVERRAIIATELSKDAGWNATNKTPELKKKAIDNMMDVIYGPSGAAPAPSTGAAPRTPGKVQIVPNPVAADTAASGLPPQAMPKPAGIPVLDTKTGKIIYR